MVNSIDDFCEKKLMNINLPKADQRFIKLVWRCLNSKLSNILDVWISIKVPLITSRGVAENPRKNVRFIETNVFS